jgi:hypothetical protein
MQHRHLERTGRDELGTPTAHAEVCEKLAGA